MKTSRGFFMKNKYLKLCNITSQACGAFAVGALIVSILVIVELVFERYFFFIKKEPLVIFINRGSLYIILFNC